jgi:hypothetical protein
VGKKKNKVEFFKKNFWKIFCLLAMAIVFSHSISIDNASGSISFSGAKIAKAQFLDDGMQSIADTNYQPPQSNQPGLWDKTKNAVSGVAKNTVGKALLWCVNVVLSAIWEIIGILLAVAGLIFDRVVDPDIFTKIMNLSAITLGWKIVRDFLNIFFILVLLFSAFCTIFQVDKYNLKKILLTLVIMALLVNFSFPIARFIIDVSNITMYYFFSQIQGVGSQANGSMSTYLSGWSNVQYALIPKSESITGSADLTKRLIASIIFLAIFTVTLLLMAILLLIRILVLAIVVIFSPIGFAAKILPGKLSSYADQWWDALFKQAFFGTIMAFMLYLAVLIMTEVNNTLFQNSGQTCKGSVDKCLVEVGLRMAIPITILWIGMLTAQKMGAEGASYATKKSSDILKGAGRKFSGANFVKRTYGAYQSRRKESDAHSASKRLGTWLGSRQDQLRSKIDQIPGSKKGAQFAALRYQRDQIQKVEEAAKLQQTENKSESDLQRLSQSGDRFEKAAATIELASRNKADDEQLNTIRGIFGPEGQVTRKLESKMKTYDPAAVFRNAQGDFNSGEALEFIQSNKFDASKLGVNSLRDADLMRMAFENRAINSKTLEDLRLKGGEYQSSIQGTITGLANMRDASTGNYAYSNMDDEIHRNIQLAHVAQTGDLSDFMIKNPGNIEGMLKYSDKDTLKRSNDWIVTHADKLGNVKSSTQLADIVTNLKKEVAHDVAKFYREGGSGEDHQRYFTNNPRVASV